MNELFETFLNAGVMRESAGLLLRGLVVTIELGLLVVPGGLALGAGLAVAQTLAPSWLERALSWGVDLLRAFPPLVLLVLVVHGLPFAGIELPTLVGVAVALTLNTSSYYGEILRAGINGVGAGQWEAARSTGLGTLAVLRFVVLPQGVRKVLPDLVGNTLEAVKLTALASVVALPDLLRMARIAQGVHFNPSPLILAAALYLAFLWPLARFVRQLGASRPVPGLGQPRR